MKRKNKNRSKFYKIDLYDFWKALYHAGVSIAIPLGDILLDVIFKTNTPTMLDWRTIAGFFISAFIGSLLKSGATNSNGELLKREKYVDL